MKWNRLRPRLPRNVVQIGAFACAHFGRLTHHRHTFAGRDIIFVREQQRHIGWRAGDEKRQHIRLRAEVKREVRTVTARRHADADLSIARVEQVVAMNLRIDPEVPRDIGRGRLAAIDIFAPNAEAAPMAVTGVTNAGLDRRAIGAGVIDIAGLGHIVTVTLRRRIELGTDRQRQQAALRAQRVDAHENIGRRIGLSGARLNECDDRRNQNEKADFGVRNAEWHGPNCNTSGNEW